MTKEQTINVVVEWWINKLRSGTPHSNGDDGLPSIFACALADSLTSSASEDSYKTFEASLKYLIKKEMEESLNRFPHLYLGCDYSPCRILSDAAKVSGINKLNFPFKTHMHIKKISDKDYSVIVYDGYAATGEELTIN